MTHYETMISFLETALGTKDIVYGYPRRATPPSGGFSQNEIYYSYQYIQKDVTPAVGQRLLSTSELYSVSVQSAYVKSCADIIDKIMRATEGTNVQFVSSSVRKDTLLELGFIGSVMLSLYKGSPNTN